MCVGGNRPLDALLRVIACANCLNVTTQTLLNQPKFHGQAYWYFTANSSFGYSPTTTINQNSADNYDNSSNLRVSWHLDKNVGGWRLGSLVWLNEDMIYYKKVFLK